MLFIKNGPVSFADLLLSSGVDDELALVLFHLLQNVLLQDGSNLIDTGSDVLERLHDGVEGEPTAIGADSVELIGEAGDSTSEGSKHIQLIQVRG